MDAAINRFIYFLKHNGIRISPSESLDAMEALAFVTLADRETVKTVLRSTLIKDIHDIALFDELFDLFMRVPEEQPHHHGHDHHHHHDQLQEPEKIIFEPEDQGITNPEAEHPHGEPADVRDYFDPEKMVSIFNPHQDPNRLSLSAMSQNLILNRNEGLLDRLMKKMTHMLKTRRVKNVAQPGDLNFHDGLYELETDLVANAMEELLDDLRESDVDEAQINALKQQVDGLIANLPELLKNYIEREMGRQREPPPHQEEIHSAYDYHFTERERQEMEEITRRLARRMRGATSHRRTIDRIGRLNASHTLRSSMRFDGVPFFPVLTNRRHERPRLVVICDVSLSVRNTARFMLHVVYSLQALFEEVRSFVFVSDLVEVSNHFEQSNIGEAIGTIFSGDVIDTDANSNYGRALEIFHDNHLSAITNRTTVIILGDGRGNRNPPNEWVLENIRRRARELIWLNPESRGSWTLGGSDMPVYEPICHRVEVVRNLTQLGKVAEQLLRRSVSVS